MKKIVFLALMVLFCSPLGAYAAGIGDPETQGQFKFGIGIDQEYVFKRDLEFKSSSPTLFPGLGITNIEVKKMYRSMIKGSFGLFDFLDIYVKLGAADYKFKSDIEYLGAIVEDFKYNTKWAFAYGGGLKGAYAFKNGLLIGGDLQYLRHKNKIRGLYTDPATGADILSITGKATFQEWQVAPYVGIKIGNFTPYLGAKYSDVRIKAKHDEEGYTLKYKADDNVGAFVGISYKIMEKLKLNLEGRFIDETALSFGLTYKF
jgi:opacity protein-like surface antigen